MEQSTAQWADVALIADFPPGQCRRLSLDGVDIAVFNVDGRYCAIEDLCSHEAAALSEGQVEGLEITCPRHAARFSLLTGAALSPPAYEPVAVFPLRIADGMLQVRDDRFD